MNNTKKKFRKMVCVFVVLCMCLNLMPLTAAADSEGTPPSLSVSDRQKFFDLIAKEDVGTRHEIMLLIADENSSGSWAINPSRLSVSTAVYRAEDIKGKLSQVTITQTFIENALLDLLTFNVNNSAYVNFVFKKLDESWTYINPPQQMMGSGLLEKINLEAGSYNSFVLALSFLKEACGGSILSYNADTSTLELKQNLHELSLASSFYNKDRVTYYSSLFESILDCFELSQPYEKGAFLADMVTKGIVELSLSGLNGVRYVHKDALEFYLDAYVPVYPQTEESNPIYGGFQQLSLPTVTPKLELWDSGYHNLVATSLPSQVDSWEATKMNTSNTYGVSLRGYSATLFCGTPLIAGNNYSVRVKTAQGEIFDIGDVVKASERPVVDYANNSYLSGLVPAHDGATEFFSTLEITGKPMDCLGT